MSASTPRQAPVVSAPTSGAHFHTDAMRPINNNTTTTSNNNNNNVGGVTTPDVNYNYYDQNPRVPSTTTTVTGSFQTDNTTNSTATTTNPSEAAANNKTPSTDVAAAPAPPSNNNNEEEDEGASPPATFRAHATCPAPTIDFLHPIRTFGGGQGGENNGDDENGDDAQAPTEQQRSVSTRVARLMFQWRYPLIVLAAGPLSQTTLHYMRSYTTKCLTGNNNNKSSGAAVSAANQGANNTTNTTASATATSSSSTTTHIVEYYPVTPDWAVEARDSIPAPVASAVSTTLWALGVPTLNALKHRNNNNYIDENTTTVTATMDTTSSVEGAYMAKVFAIESEDHGYPTTSTPDNAAPFSLIISVASALVLLFVNTVLLVEQHEEEEAAAAAAANEEDGEGDDDGNYGQGSTFLPQYRSMQQNNTATGNVPRLNLTGSGSPIGNNNNNARQHQHQQQQDNNTNTTTTTATFSSNDTSPQLTARHSTEHAASQSPAPVPAPASTSAPGIRDLHHHHRNRPAPKIVVAVEGHLSIPEANLLLATIGEHNKYYEEHLDDEVGGGDVTKNNNDSNNNTMVQHLPPNIVEGVVFTSSPTPIPFEMEMITEQEYRKHRRLLQRREENPYLPPFLLQSMCSPSGSFSWLNTGSTPTTPTSSAAPSPLMYGATNVVAGGVTPLTTLLQSDADLFPVASETPEGYIPTRETYFLVIPDSIDAKFVRHVSSVENFAKILEAGCQEAETLQHHNYDTGSNNHQLTTVFVSIPAVINNNTIAATAAPTPDTTTTSTTQKHACAASKLRDLLYQMPSSKHHHTNSPDMAPLTLPTLTTTTNTTTTNSSKLSSLLLGGNGGGGGGAAKLASLLGSTAKETTASTNAGRVEAADKRKGDLEGFLHPYDVMYVFSSSDLRNAAMETCCNNNNNSTTSLPASSGAAGCAHWSQLTVTLPPPSPFSDRNSTTSPVSSLDVQPSSARLFALLKPNGQQQRHRDSDTTSSNGWSAVGGGGGPIPTSPLDAGVYPAAPIFAAVATLLNHRHEHVDIQ